MKLWTIRDEQMKAFEEPLREEFLRRATQFLRGHFERCKQMPREELDALAEKGLLQAQSYGIVTERDVCKFLGVTAVLGDELAARYDWARRILQSDAGPTLKVNRLVARAASEAGETRGKTK